jgi:hypothetical protein
MSGCDDEAQAKLSRVYIPRERLLKMSSAELDEHIRSLNACHFFSEAELREMKRQRRRVKNREDARISRIRKKQYVRELEDENQALRDRLDFLECEYRKVLSSASDFGSKTTRPNHFITPPPSPPLERMSIEEIKVEDDGHEERVDLEMDFFSSSTAFV